MKFVFFSLLLIAALKSFAQSGSTSKIVSGSTSKNISGAVSENISGSGSENIFIITTDGFRWQEVFNGADPDLINSSYVKDTNLLRQMYGDADPNIRREKLMPFFWNTIARQGQLYGNRFYQNKVDVTNLYKISYPGYNEMLTGFPDPLFIPNIPLRNPNTNVLDFLNSKKEFEGQIAAFSSWNIFNAILNKKKNRFPMNCGYDQVEDSSLNNQLINASQDNVAVKKNTRYDMLTYLCAREYIEQHHPRVVLIGFGETDEFAHQGRYDLYLQGATHVDRMIEELWYYVQTDPFYRNKTTFIITTDHGRGRKQNTWNKHGILTGGSGETWFALIGPNIQPLGEVRDNQQAYQKQMAPTIAFLIGEKYSNRKSNAVPLVIPMNLVSEKELSRQ